MADFARWVNAAELALGLEAGSFINTYRDNRAGAVQLTLESSLLTGPVEALAEEGFEGSATELLERLATLAGEDTLKKRGWPTRPHVLSGQLRRLAPALRRTGVEVEFVRGRKTRTIRIRQLEQVGEEASQASRTVTRDAGDARDADFPTQSSDNGASPDDVDRLAQAALDAIALQADEPKGTE
jgi:hypothetical protein